MSQMFSRRQAIKTFLIGSAFSNVIGQSWTAPLLHEISPASVNRQNGILRLNLNEFPVLKEASGSVRITTSGLDSRGERKLGFVPPVLINRATTGALYAMSAECTHEGCIVRRFDPTVQRMVCPCHGSQYAIDGAVLQGPAGFPLLRYETRLSGDLLDIELPDVFFEIQSRLAAGNRLELSFLAFDQITYEVHYRARADAEPQRVPFATSPSGALAQTELRLAEADIPSLFVERPAISGIFQIVMMTQTV